MVWCFGSERILDAVVMVALCCESVVKVCALFKIYMGCIKIYLGCILRCCFKVDDSVSHVVFHRAPSEVSC